VFCYLEPKALDGKLKTMFYLNELKGGDINKSNEQSMIVFISNWVDKEFTSIN
jgi:hypothetical protein